MRYRIRVVPEVEAWLDELRGSDPGAAELVDGAVDALRDAGPGLGPPLVVPVEALASETRPDLDHVYQRRLEMLTRVRRGIADVATSRKRLERQIEQLEATLSELTQQPARGPESRAGNEPSVRARLAGLRRQYEDLEAEEERLTLASQRLQLKVDAFRARKEAAKAAQAAMEAAAEVDQAAAEIEALIAAAGGPGPDDTGRPDDAAPRGVVPLLSELRPGAPESAAIRILFTVDPPDTAVLLAAGTERDWLQAWYAEMILRCRTRHERYLGDPG